MGCFKLHIEDKPTLRLAYSKKGQKPLKIDVSYYPFGLQHKGYNNTVTSNSNTMAEKFAFGGKEYGEELGLDWYDISARNYDPALGRWMNIDPLAEQMRRHSPYNYAFDNPVYFIDADGMSPLGSVGGSGYGGNLIAGGSLDEINKDLPLGDEPNYLAGESGGDTDPVDNTPAVNEGNPIQLDEVIVIAPKSKKYDITDDSNSDFTIYGNDKDGDSTGREGIATHSINSDDIVTPRGGGGTGGADNPFLRFVKYLQDLFSVQQDVQRAIDLVNPTVDPPEALELPETATLERIRYVATPTYGRNRSQIHTPPARDTTVRTGNEKAVLLLNTMDSLNAVKIRNQRNQKFN